MTITETILELKITRNSWTRPVAFVPTMGALHEGHLKLLRKARESVGSGGTVLTSIFVNPLQFDRKCDLSQYPRTLEADLEYCRLEGVDHVFCPSPDEFYQADHSTQVLESSLSNRLCGATRPGHFDGVCTVVLKLFNLIQPDYAIFGKKDYQQLAIIKRLIRDLSLDIEILPTETHRESDGLAMSSRNRNLSAEARKDASRLRKALLAAQSLSETGEQDPHRYLTAARHQLSSPLQGFKIDYLELVSQLTLQPLSKVTEPAILAIAAFYDDVRLIDNIEIIAK